MNQSLSSIMNQILMNKILIIAFFILLNPSFGEDSVVLNKELVVPANQDYIDLPVLSISSDKIENRIGYGIHIDSWSNKFYLCRIHLNQNIRKIKKNTLIVLSGEYEIEKTSSGIFAHKFFVKEPKEIEYIACGTYVEYYRSLMGEKERLVSRTFPENFK